MAFGERFRSVLPTEPRTKPAKAGVLSGKLSSFLGKRAPPPPAARSQEEVTELLGVLLRLGLAVCSVSPDESMSRLQAMTSTEFEWLHKGGNKVLDGLLIGQLGFVVESAVSGFLTQEVEGEGDGFDSMSRSRSDSDESSFSGGKRSGSAPKEAHPVGLSTVSAEVSPHRRRPSLSDALAPMFQRRGSKSDSVSSVSFIRNMLKRQGDTNQAVTTGDLKWTPDGCPVDDAGDGDMNVSQSVSLFQRYSKHGEGLQVPAQVVTARRPSNASLHSFSGGGPWEQTEPVLHTDSLLVHMLQAPNSVLARHVPQQQSQQFEYNYHSQRLQSGVMRYQLPRKEDRLSSDGACSVSTCVLLDMARGVGPTGSAGGGPAAEADSMSDPSVGSPMSVPTGVRSISDTALHTAESEGRQNGFEGSLSLKIPTEATWDSQALDSIVEGQASEGIDPMEEAEIELDPVKKYEHRKKMMKNRKANAMKSGKVTYGSLLRSTSGTEVDDPSAGMARGPVARPAPAETPAIVSPALPAQSPPELTAGGSNPPPEEPSRGEDDAASRWKKRKDERRARKHLGDTYGAMVRANYASTTSEVPEGVAQAQGPWRPGVAAEAYMSAPPVPSGESDDADPNARWRRRREQIRERRRTMQKNTYGRVIRSEHEQNLHPNVCTDTFELDKPLPGVPDSPVGPSFGAQVIASTGVDPALKTHPILSPRPPERDFSKESMRRSWTSESLLQPRQGLTQSKPALSPPLLQPPTEATH